MNPEFIELIDQAINTDIDFESTKRICQILNQNLKENNTVNFDYLNNLKTQNLQGVRLKRLLAIIQIECFHNFNKAYDVLSESLETNYLHAPTWEVLGDLLSIEEDRKIESEEAYRKAIEIDPNNALFHSKLGILIIKDPLRRSEGKEELELSINLDPDDLDNYREASFAFVKNNVFIDDAIKLLHYILKKDPNDIKAQHNLASAYVFKGINKDEATQVWEKLDNELPDNEIFKFSLAKRYISEKRNLEEAEEILIKLSNKYPENTFIIHDLAKLYLNQKDSKSKLPEILNKLEGFRDTDENINLLLIDIYSLLGKSNLVKQICENSLKAYPNNHLFLFWHAFTLMNSGELSKAKEQIEKAISLNDAPGYWNLLSMIFILDNNIQESLEAIQTSLSLEHELDQTWALLILVYSELVTSENNVVHSQIVLNASQKFLSICNKKSLLEHVPKLIEISRESDAPCFTLWLHERLKALDISFFDSLSYENTIELLRLGEVHEDPLFLASIYHLGGNSDMAFKILDQSESIELESDFQYQYYFYLSAKTYFNLDYLSVLNSALQEINKKDWSSSEFSLKQRYYAGILLLISFEEELVSDVELIHQILVKASTNIDPYYYSLLYYYINRNQLGSIEELEYLLINEINNKNLSSQLSPRVIKETDKSLFAQIEGYLHLIELNNIFYDLSELFSQYPISDSKYQNLSSWLSKMYRDISLSQPLKLWRIDPSFSEDILADNEIQETNWLEEIESQLQSHPKLYVLLKYDQQDINPQMIATWMEALISNKGLFEKFLSIIDYYRIKKVLSYEDRNLLRIYAHICLDRSRVLTFDEKWVKLIIASVSGFCLGFVPDVMLHSTGFIDDSWTATISERIYSFLRKKYESNELSSIVYTSLTKSLDF